MIAAASDVSVSLAPTWTKDDTVFVYILAGACLCEFGFVRT